MKHTLNSLVFAILTYYYASIYWLGGLPPEDSLKPFVYRQLVPLLSQGLVWFGVQIDIAVILVVVVCGVGFYLSLASLMSFYGVRNSLYPLLAVVIGLCLFSSYRKSYDLMTAFLWTLSFLFIVQRRDREFLLLFPLVVLNRQETAPLLLLSFMLVRKNWFVGISGGIIFYVIWSVVHYAFRDVAGADVWISPVQNMWTFIEHPWLTLCHLVATFGILGATFFNWQGKPKELRDMFTLLSFALTILYFVCGQSFETRVFWEIYPLVVVLILYGSSQHKHAASHNFAGEDVIYIKRRLP